MGTESNAVAELTVPSGNLIWMGLTVVLLVGIAIAGVVLARNHVKSWTYDILVGFVASLAGSYLLCQVVLWGLSLIPAVGEWSRNHETTYWTISSVWQMICQTLSTFLGIWYLIRSKEKKAHELTHIGNVFTFGLAGYIAQLLVGNILFGSVQYISTARTINAGGFANSVQGLVANGYTEAESTEYLLSIVNLDAVNYFIGALSYVFQGVLLVAVCGMIFGAMTGKMPKIWNAFGIIFLVLYYAPTILTGYFEIEIWKEIIICFVVAAVATALFFVNAKSLMPEEFKTLNYSRKEEQKKEMAKENKMPKIVMPKIDYEKKDEN